MKTRRRSEPRGIHDSQTDPLHVLRHFQIGNLDAEGWQKARRLPFTDFEDAVVATVAEATASAFIVTRNTADFAGSPIPAITPLDFLSQLEHADDQGESHRAL